MSLVNKALSSTALISVGLLAQVGGAVSLFAAETDGEQTKGAAIAALGLATASVGMLMDAPRPRRSQLRWAAVNPHRVMGALFRAGGGKDRRPEDRLATGGPVDHQERARTCVARPG